MGIKNILAINDEGHHCYREKPQQAEELDLKGDEKKEAEKKQRGRPPVDQRPGDCHPQIRCYPGHRTCRQRRSFLRGSGYAEGHIVPWTMSDFLADGCNRIWDCQTAASARCRQHSWQRDAHVP